MHAILMIISYELNISKDQHHDELIIPTKYAKINHRLCSMWLESSKNLQIEKEAWMGWAVAYYMERNLFSKKKYVHLLQTAEKTFAKMERHEYRVCKSIRMCRDAEIISK